MGKELNYLAATLVGLEVNKTLSVASVSAIWVYPPIEGAEAVLFNPSDDFNDAWKLLIEANKKHVVLVNLQQTELHKYLKEKEAHCAVLNYVTGQSSEARDSSPAYALTLAIIRALAEPSEEIDTIILHEQVKRGNIKIGERAINGNTVSYDLLFNEPVTTIQLELDLSNSK